MTNCINNNKNINVTKSKYLIIKHIEYIYNYSTEKVYEKKLLLVIHINNQRINCLEFLGNTRLPSVVVSNNKSQLEKRGDWRQRQEQVSSKDTQKVP